MRRYIVMVMCIGVCILACPMQSCANGGKSAEATVPVADTLVPAAESAESVDTKKPEYRITVEALLKQACQQSSKTNFPLFFARQFLDVPYVAHTLEVNDEEELVINSSELDCTTLVETVTALTLCVYQKQFTFGAFQENLRHMRYRNGIIDRYPSRIHYFTDWIVENSKAGIVSEIQEPTPPFTAVQTVKVNYMSQHPRSYKALREHPEYIPEIAEMEQRISGSQFRYIPKSEVKNTAAMREVVHDGDIIAITCNKAGLDIAHLGFAVWREDGLHLLNASQLHKKVVEEPMTLYQYLRKHPSHTGIRIIRIIQ